MDFSDLEGLYKCALNSKNDEVMAMVGAWENILNYLIKSFETESTSLAFITSKVRERKRREEVNKSYWYMPNIIS